MNTTVEKSDNLCHLADLLATKQSAVIADWRRRAIGDSQLDAVQELSKSAFVDHIPQFLEALRESLIASARNTDFVSSNQEPIPGSRPHAEVRWRQGFRLSEVVRDWNHLRAAILAAINEAIVKENFLLDRALHHAVQILSDLILDGINSSVEQFEDLQKNRAHAQQRELQASIERLEALSAQQAISYRKVTHDLAGNLGMLRAIAGNGLKRNNDSKASPSHLESIYEGLRHSLELLKDLRDRSAHSAGSGTPLWEKQNASELLASIARPFATQAEETGMTFLQEGPPELWVQTDRAKLIRIAQNLLINAFKYTDRGVVSLSWDKSADNRTWYLQVTNQGSFHNKVRKNQYAPVARSTSHRRFASLSEFSFGIGLDIAHELAGQLMGFLDIQTDQNQSQTIARLVLLREAPTTPHRSETSPHTNRASIPSAVQSAPKEP